MARSLHPPLLLALALAATALTGCGTPPPAPPQEASSALPEFRLPPASLGRTLAWQQRLQVVAQGRVQPPVDALVEVEPTMLRMALMSAGQTLARLEWDGQTMNTQRSPMWPASIAPERVLSDLQLALWPRAQLVAALPADAQLDDEPGGLRVLRLRGDKIASVQGAESLHIELVNHRFDYRLRIDSTPLSTEPNPTEAKP